MIGWGNKNVPSQALAGKVIEIQEIFWVKEWRQSFRRRDRLTPSSKEVWRRRANEIAFWSDTLEPKGLCRILIVFSWSVSLLNYSTSPYFLCNFFYSVQPFTQKNKGVELNRNNWNRQNVGYKRINSPQLQEFINFKGNISKHV